MLWLNAAHGRIWFSWLGGTKFADCALMTKLEKITLRITYFVRHEDVKRYVCNECPKCFYTAGELTQHQPVHSDYKQFCCGLCGKDFKHKTYVKSYFKKCSDRNVLFCSVHPMDKSIVCFRVSFLTHGVYLQSCKSYGRMLLVNCQWLQRLFVAV